MAEYVFATSYQGCPVRVRMGWSRSLQRYYLLVEYTERNQAPVYDHRGDPDVTRYTTLRYFVRKLVSLGLTIPKAAVRGLAAAPWRDGTATHAHGAQRVTRDSWKKPMSADKRGQVIRARASRSGGCERAPARSRECMQ